MDLNALATVLDSTFGHSGATSGPTQTVVGLKAQIVDNDKVKIFFTSVISIHRDLNIRLLKGRESDLADAYLKAALAKAKTQYKEDTGKSITFDQTHAQDDLQSLSASNINPIRTAYYRKFYTLSVKEG